MRKLLKKGPEENYMPSINVLTKQNKFHDIAECKMILSIKYTNPLSCFMLKYVLTEDVLPVTLIN